MKTLIRQSILTVAMFIALQGGTALAFNIGDRVQCTQNLNVRSTPSTSGTLVTTESAGSQGNIASGPQSGSGYTWWYINWANGYSGWSVQDYLQLVPPPTAQTQAASSITTSSATLNSFVNANGYSTTIYFQFGTTTSYGSTTSTGNIGTGSGNYGYSISGLSPGTTYHFRIVANNSGGTTYGSDLTFTTLAPAPTAQTTAATSITTTSAQLNGNINGNGIWGTVYWQYGTTTGYGYTTPSGDMGPTAGTGSYTVSGLSQNTLYHFRVVAVSSGGTTYGGDMTFTTATQPAPTAQTTAATSITTTTAQLNGNINGNGVWGTVYWQYGTTTSYGNTTPSGDMGPTAGTGSYVVSGLVPNTLYHFQVVAVSSGGTTYGGDLTFTTGALPLPIVQTLAATAVAANSAQLNASLNPNGSATTAYFEYGTTTSYGTVTTTGNFGTTSQNVSFNVTSLSPNTTYHYRIRASNANGASTGNDVTFVTSGTGAPTVQTLAATAVTTSSAQLNASINPNGFATPAYFQYGLTTAYGTATASGNFGTTVQNIGFVQSGLTPNTTYHYRIVASNSQGTSTGLDTTFTTLPTTTTSQQAWVAGTGGIGLRLRSSPSLSASVLLVMSEGSSVTLLSDTQTADGYLWRHVTYSSQTGWADAEYLVFTQGTPTPPAAPITLRQLQADGFSPIVAGGTANASSVVLAATPSGSSSQQFSVQFEVRPAGTTFSSPTITSVTVQGGTEARVTVNNLLNQGYHWRAQVLDGNGLTSGWVNFSGNASDFTVAAPNVSLALFTWSPSQIFVGDTAQFTANASGTTGLTFSWNFGNGDTASGGTVSEVFGQVGQYTVTLTITDSQGNQNVQSHTVTVASKQLVDAINKLAQNSETLLFQMIPQAENCANAADQFKPAVDSATANIAAEGVFQALFLGVDLSSDLDLVQHTLGQTILSGTVAQAQQDAANLAISKLYGQNNQSCYQLFIPNITAYIMQQSNSIEQLRQQAITASASLNSTTAAALVQNLQARYNGNLAISDDYSSKVLLPTTFAQLQRDDEDSWTYITGENLFSASVGLGLAAAGDEIDGPLAIMLTVSSHSASGTLDSLNILAEQSTDAQMLGLCMDALGQANFSARLMTENVTTGLDDVISAQSPATPSAQMTIQHIAQGELSNFGYTPRWLIQNAYANISVQNTGTEGADYRVEAIYAKSFTTVSLFPFWTDGIGQRNYDINTISASNPVHLNPGQQAQIQIYYKTQEGGQIPDGNITYYLTATTSGGNYLEQLQTGHFGTTYEDTNGNVVAQSNLPAGLLDTQSPVSSSLLQYSNSPICTLNISVNNPYESPVLVDVSQPLPNGTTVIDAAGGTTNGNKIVWELNLQPSASTVLPVTLQLPAAFTNQPLPDTTASIYDSANAAWINLDSTPSFIQVTNVPAAQLQPIGLNNNGFNLSVRAFVPGAYQVQTTTNFTTWTPIATSTNVQGTININDPTAQSRPYQFYRAAKVQ